MQDMTKIYVAVNAYNSLQVMLQDCPQDYHWIIVHLKSIVVLYLQSNFICVAIGQ